VIVLDIPITITDGSSSARLRLTAIGPLFARYLLFCG